MNAIHVKNLSKSFGNFTAVDNLSFEVEEHRVFGFLGPNGAGKTTTIRLMVGLSKPTSGDIEIAGKKIVFGKTDANHLFGYLPEQPAFYGWMSASEYLSFVADLFNLDGPAKKKRVEKLLEMVGLTDARKKKISSYSLGMKQRLGIAQALVGEPDVLILDEPVSALDPIGRKEVLAIIENLKKEKTIFMSTHILSDVDKVCDDVAIINKGKLVTISPLSQLKSKYAKPILEIECSNDPQEFTSDLQKEKWVERFEKSGNHLKVWLHDGTVVENNIPLAFFARQKVGILKYGLSLPETEDLFMELVKTG